MVHSTCLHLFYADGEMAPPRLRCPFPSSSCQTFPHYSSLPHLSWLWLCCQHAQVSFCLSLLEPVRTSLKLPSHLSPFSHHPNVRILKPEDRVDNVHLLLIYSSLRLVFLNISGNFFLCNYILNGLSQSS